MGCEHKAHPLRVLLTVWRPRSNRFVRRREEYEGARELPAKMKPMIAIAIAIVDGAASHHPHRVPRPMVRSNHHRTRCPRGLISAARAMLAVSFQTAVSRRRWPASTCGGQPRSVRCGGIGPHVSRPALGAWR